MTPWIRPADAEDCDLVGIGGDLSPETLLAAYREGVFPWFSEGDPIYWWSPNPRAIFELDQVHCSRRLQRTIRSGQFRLSLNQAFRDVITACADRPSEGTWITADIIDAYHRLHQRGHAHSIEVWQGDRLVGGLYGVAIGGLFAGESMFHRVRDASKVALVAMTDHLRKRGYVLFDTQMVTPHTIRMGAVEIPRSEYLARLAEAIRLPVQFDESNQ